MKLDTRLSGLIAVILWLAFLLVCGVIISRSIFTTDLSAFLPSKPTAEQRLLMDQIRDGLASRLILVGIEGADAPTRAQLSKQIAQQLRTDAHFVTVNNGEPVNTEHDRAFLFNHRYLLSPAVNPARFSVDGLHTAISDSIDMLASPVGLMFKSMLPHDPTGEMIQLLDQLNSGNQPHQIDGAWASTDGNRALLLFQTQASGSDTDAQQAAMSAIQKAFAQANASSQAKLIMTGPGVFSVTARDTIKTQVSRLSIISVVLIASLLLLVYRSVTALVLGFLPVISGALAGVAAVSLGFGTVHGITLGFGTALIGEAVDYSIYLFVQSKQSGTNQKDWLKRFWPTIRLGVLTSICGFAALLFSGFPGLAQLGLYATVGLLAAAAVTRFVLPHLLPAKFHVHNVAGIGIKLSYLVQRANALRWPAVILLVVCCAILINHKSNLWSGNIASLSPVSPAEIALDAKLRADMGAPDVRYLVLVSGASQEAVLQASEQVSAVLQTQVKLGKLAGFESPSRYLPSIATQHARQASIPSATEMQTRLTQAVKGLPINAQRFTPFLDEVEVAKHLPLLQASDLKNTSMAMALDALLIEKNNRWSALHPLTAPHGADIDADHMRAALSASYLPNALFIDMKAVSDNLYAGYLHEAIMLSIGGLAAIILLLLTVYKSPRRVIGIITPLVAAVITVTAGLAIFGQQLIILHLVGLLLVVAVGSNYALFFDRPDPHTPISAQTLASMLFANLTAVAGFGLLAFSKVSILQALGVTVAPGVILALIYSAIFAPKTHAK